MRKVRRDEDEDDDDDDDDDEMNECKSVWALIRIGCWEWE